MVNGAVGDFFAGFLVSEEIVKVELEQASKNETASSFDLKRLGKSALKTFWSAFKK